MQMLRSGWAKTSSKEYSKSIAVVCLGKADHSHKRLGGIGNGAALCYTSEMHFIIQADGGSRGNPGRAGSGAVIYDHAGKVYGEVSEYLGITTNNVAEYTAILRALELLRTKLGVDAANAIVKIEMDSKLVVEQMNGNYKIKHPNLKPLASRVLALVQGFHTVTFTHIPRAKNAAADALANLAMDRGE